MDVGSLSLLTIHFSCRNHPVYVLERHIGRYFALKPDTKKAGMHRGEGYYPRDALAELHTADRYHCPSCMVCTLRTGQFTYSVFACSRWKCVLLHPKEYVQYLLRFSSKLLYKTLLKLRCSLTSIPTKFDKKFTTLLPG